MFRTKITIYFLFVILFLFSCAREDRQSMVISGGKVDLSTWNFSKNYIRLDGEWEFYWNKLLNADVFARGNVSTPVLITVPSNWNGTVVGGKPIDGYGYATYRLKIKMKYDERMYGLKLIDAGTSYMFLSGVFGILFLAYLSIKKVRGASIALVGILAIYLAGINDVLYSNMVINTMYCMPIALFIFILAQSLLLAMFFMRAFVKARNEAEINLKQSIKIQRQNEFITNVLKVASDSILNLAEKISDSINQFRDNESEHAAHTEEVASSIEEMVAGTNLVADNTNIQNSNLEILDNSIQDLASVIDRTGKEVADTLETVQRISKDARSGNEALSIMGHSINIIFESSTQVNGIIQIINDISAAISEINEIAQKNSQAIEQIAHASKSLVEMVDKFSNEIRNYHD